MAQRMWDGSGFYTHITSPALSEDCAVDGNHRLEFYRAVVLELNPDKLPECVKAAEEAIRARASLNGEILSDERVAIENTTSDLNVFQAAIIQSDVRIVPQPVRTLRNTEVRGAIRRRNPK